MRLSLLTAPEAIHPRNPFKLLIEINNNLLSIGCMIFNAEDFLWKRPIPQKHFLEERTTIKDSLGPFSNYQQAIPTLRKLNILYTNQLLDGSNKLQPIADIRKRADLNSRRRKPI